MEERVAICGDPVRRREAEARPPCRTVAHAPRVCGGYLQRANLSCEVYISHDASEADCSEAGRVQRYMLSAGHRGGQRVPDEERRLWPIVAAVFRRRHPQPRRPVRSVWRRAGQAALTGRAAHGGPALGVTHIYICQRRRRRHLASRQHHRRAVKPPPISPSRHGDLHSSSLTGSGQPQRDTPAPVAHARTHTVCRVALYLPRSTCACHVAPHLPHLLSLSRSTSPPRSSGYPCFAMGTPLESRSERGMKGSRAGSPSYTMERRVTI